MVTFYYGHSFFVSYIQPSSLNSDLKIAAFYCRTCTSSRKVANHKDIHSFIHDFSLFCLFQRPKHLWNPSNLLYNGYIQSFPWGESGWGMKLTSHTQLSPIFMTGSTLPAPQFSRCARGKLNFYFSFLFFHSF